MNGHSSWRQLMVISLLLGLLLGARAGVPNEEVITRDQPGQMYQKRGEVRHKSPATPETAAVPPQPLQYDDRLRTLSFSSASVQLEDQFHLRLRERTRLEIQRQPLDPLTPVARIESGACLVSSGGKSIPIETPHAQGIPKGTEFLVEVKSGQTEVTLFQGEVELSNGAETLTISSGQQGIVVPGRRIEVRPVLQATNIVQWWIYYPGVLNPEDLPFSPKEERSLADSLTAYRQGDLRSALEGWPHYPDLEPPSSEALALYQSALFLSAGAVDRAQLLLAGIRGDTSGGRALRMVLAAISGSGSLFAAISPPPEAKTLSSFNSSEWLALSYLRQAEHRLAEALQAARHSVRMAPRFGFAWARLAELEFSLGNIRAAKRAIDRAVELSPLNAQAQAIRGFLLAAQNDMEGALAQFNQAIRLDSSLPEGWLGRGLCRLRRGDRANGLHDLRKAVVIEPSRSLPRSYLGKAFDLRGDIALARQELDLAEKLDPNDPTPWLYRALLNQRENRINEAVSDLQRSMQLNDDRLLFRSRLQLDQDRGVRGANLALIYEDAGMTEFSLRQASRAVSDDYANAAAHLLLANSYNALRDPFRVNLRYETAWWSEWLMASLLAPVGATPLSPALAHHEYSRLFESEGAGLANRSLVTSHGDVWQSSAQYGRFPDLAYAIDGLYHRFSQVRPNSDLENFGGSVRFQAQLGLFDSVFLHGLYSQTKAGDVAPYYDPAEAHLQLQVREFQEPIVVAGWHHEWKPGSHTLLLVSPWNNRLTWTDPEYDALLTIPDQQGNAYGALQPVSLQYENRFAGISAELQQIWQTGPNTAIAGLRFQTGAWDAQTSLDLAPSGGIHTGRVSPGLDRRSLYFYDQLDLTDWMSLSAGLSYDRLKQPLNFRIPPLSDSTHEIDQLSPKGGVVFKPWRDGRLRAAYARSLSGVSFDQSYRLEPTHLAGLNQAYRGLIPESSIGSVAGQKIQTGGIAWEQDFATGTFLTLQAEHLESEAERHWGAFDLTDPNTPKNAAYDEHLAFQERTFSIAASQLVERDLALSARYRLSDARLHSRLIQPLGNLGHPFPLEERALLHEVSLAASYNHPSGFFGRWESRWTRQSNREDMAHLPGDDFWQHDLWLGWRLARRQVEISAGILNLTDQDYQLAPINYRPDTFRRRTVAFSLQFYF